VLSIHRNKLTLLKSTFYGSSSRIEISVIRRTRAANRQLSAFRASIRSEFHAQGFSIRAAIALGRRSFSFDDILVRVVNWFYLEKEEFKIFIRLNFIQMEHQCYAFRDTASCRIPAHRCNDSGARCGVHTLRIFYLGPRPRGLKPRGHMGDSRGEDAASLSQFSGVSLNGFTHAVLSLWPEAERIDNRISGRPSSE